MTRKSGTSKKRRSRASLLLLEPRRVGAAEFKARCLELMGEVERLGMEIVITRHRKPVARLVPAAEPSPRFCGSLSGMLLEAHDLVRPIGEHWESDEPNLT